MKHFLHLDLSSRPKSQHCNALILLLLLWCERNIRKERAFIVYEIGLEDFDNRAKCVSERFQRCVKIVYVPQCKTQIFAAMSQVCSL